MVEVEWVIVARFFYERNSFFAINRRHKTAIYWKLPRFFAHKYQYCNNILYNGEANWHLGKMFLQLCPFWVLTVTLKELNLQLSTITWLGYKQGDDYWIKSTRLRNFYQYTNMNVYYYLQEGENRPENKTK